MMMRHRGVKPLAAALSLAFLAGCATFSEDGGFTEVSRDVTSRTGVAAIWQRSDAETGAARRRVQELLAQPLGVEAAVEVALLNNRGLQAAFAGLGIAEAELVQAGTWINPGFKFGRFTRGDEIEIERALVFNVMALLTLEARSEIAGHRFSQARRAAAMSAVQLASDTRRAWVDAVAAQQSLAYFAQVQDAADAGAELAERMARAGNFSRLQRMREQAFYADAAAQLARARQAAHAAREKLTRLLGLWGADTAFTLPDRLPELPDALTPSRAIETVAMRERLDLRIARAEAESLAAAAGLTESTRYVNVFDLDLVRNSESDKPRQKGWEVEFRLPVFDRGDARLADAQHRYAQAFHRTAQLAINARSEVREADVAYRAAWELARHYRDEIVPLRKKISEENLLRYNGMLIGVFELLADARTSISSVNGYIGALREYWLAESALRMALEGGSPGTMGIGAPAAMAAGGDAGGGH